MALYSKRETYTPANTGIIIYTLLTVIWLWAVLSFREPTGDPWRYMQGLHRIAQLSFLELFNNDKVPLGFALLNWFTALVSTKSLLFFSLVYALCVMPLYLAFRERVSKSDAAVLMMMYLLYPFYINYLASGFKQGIAFGFMLWGLSCILDKAKPKWRKGLLLLFVATLFHPSFWLINTTLAVWYFIYRKASLNWSILTLAISIFIAMLGLAEPIISLIMPIDIVDSLGYSTYFNEDFLASEEYLSIGYIAGFRVDFTIFTIFPLLVLFFLNRKMIHNPLYPTDMIKFFCLIASTYFLLVFIPYSDRIASFAWFLIPFVLFIQLGFLKTLKYRNRFVLLLISLYPFLMLVYVKNFFQ